MFDGKKNLTFKMHVAKKQEMLCVKNFKSYSKFLKFKHNDRAY